MRSFTRRAFLTATAVTAAVALTPAVSIAAPQNYSIGARDFEKKGSTRVRQGRGRHRAHALLPGGPQG